MGCFKKKYIRHCLGAAILSLLPVHQAVALDIIPGLKGFGTNTRAAYGAANTPEICIVDNTTDYGGNPSWNSSNYSVGVFKGSLLQCLEGLDTLNGETIDGHVVKANSGKIVLFEVSGTIKENASANDDESFRYKIGSYTTIAGQTSPEPGILLRNISMYGGDVHDVLMQHVRGRMDGPPSTQYGLHRSFSFSTGSGSVYNIVIDHVSSAWGADGQITFYHGNNKTMSNITMSHCILAESRENMGLAGEEYSNGKNCMFGTYNSPAPTNFLALGNLFSNSKKRNPKIQNAHGLLVNNYLYNNSELGTQCEATHNAMTCAMVGNVMKGGPMSGTYASLKLPNLGTSPWETPVSQNRVYLYGNTTNQGTQSSSADWSDVDLRPGNTTAYGHTADFKVTGETPSVHSPLWPAGLTFTASSSVKGDIIENVGAYPAFRDSIDARLINELASGTGPPLRVTGAPSSGDWPALAKNTIKLSIPSNPHGDSDYDGYTNLEEWLHSQSARVEGRSATYVPESPMLSPPEELEVR